MSKPQDMKLSAHRAGLPGKEISFLIVPLDPAYKAGLAGHLPVKDAKIAIIGSGPAGLSCTYHLVNSGYRAAVFGVEDRIGGNVRLDENN